MHVRKRSKPVRKTLKRSRSLTARVEVLEDEMTGVKANLAALRGVPAQVLALQNELSSYQLNMADRFAHLEALFIDETEQVKQSFSDQTDKLLRALGGLPCAQNCTPSDTQPYEPVEVKK